MINNGSVQSDPCTKVSAVGPVAGLGFCPVKIFYLESRRSILWSRFISALIESPRNGVRQQVAVAVAKGVLSHLGPCVIFRGAIRRTGI